MGDALQWVWENGSTLVTGLVAVNVAVAGVFAALKGVAALTPSEADDRFIDKAQAKLATVAGWLQRALSVFPKPAVKR